MRGWVILVNRPSERRPSVKALERGLEVLDHLLTVAEEPLHDMAAATGIPPSTLHRLLAVLEAHGYVTSYHGIYRVGIKGWLLTASRAAIRQLLEELSREVGETVNFGMVIDHEIEFVERAVFDHPLSFVVQVGSRVPLHCSAMGKAVLAFRPELRTGLKLVPRTPYSITDETRLTRELEQVAIRGFALDVEEFIEGVACVAVPVRDKDGLVVGAISISGPHVRLTTDRAVHLVESLKTVSGRVSQLLG